MATTGTIDQFKIQLHAKDYSSDEEEDGEEEEPDVSEDEDEQENERLVL